MKRPIWEGLDANYGADLSTWPLGMVKVVARILAAYDAVKEQEFLEQRRMENFSRQMGSQ